MKLIDRHIHKLNLQSQNICTNLGSKITTMDRSLVRIERKKLIQVFNAIVNNGEQESINTNILMNNNNTCILKLHCTIVSPVASQFTTAEQKCEIRHNAEVWFSYWY